MNCKPGDLAVIVRSAAGNEGRIVQCVEFLGEVLWNARGVGTIALPTWRIDQELQGWLPGFAPAPLIPDCQLRPIRDNDGEDEMLRIAGKPADIKTKEIA